MLQTKSTISRDYSMGKNSQTNDVVVVQHVTVGSLSDISKLRAAQVLKHKWWVRWTGHPPPRKIYPRSNRQIVSGILQMTIPDKVHTSN